MQGETGVFLQYSSNNLQEMLHIHRHMSVVTSQRLAARIGQPYNSNNKGKTNDAVGRNKDNENEYSMKKIFGAVS